MLRNAFKHAELAADIWWQNRNRVTYSALQDFGMQGCEAPTCSIKWCREPNIISSKTTIPPTFGFDF